MKRPRPYVPLSVRVKVAERQIGKFRPFYVNSDRERLSYFLRLLGNGAPMQLDHDPALILRKFSPRTGKYTPDANDPDFLVYREKADHLEKTVGRKAGAERTVTTKGSDIGLKAKFARLEGRTKQRPKMKIPSRPFPSKRKMK